LQDRVPVQVSLPVAWERKDGKPIQHAVWYFLSTVVFSSFWSNISPMM